MKLNLYETTCGDGRCVITENFKTCPADCPQSGSDSICRAKTDFTCDPACSPEHDDIDCVFPGNPLVMILVIITFAAAGPGVWYLIRRRKGKKT